MERLIKKRTKRRGEGDGSFSRKPEGGGELDSETCGTEKRKKNKKPYLRAKKCQNFLLQREPGKRGGNKTSFTCDKM